VFDKTLKSENFFI